MTTEQAEAVVVEMVAQSRWLRGYLYGREAWGRVTLPDVAKETCERANLANVFSEIGEALKVKEDA